mmetsp:Transcript_16675/g.32632  ORF Transcript_16675/g.32632 Transcript_16675/m.32632 type:complete len:235 (-) Transcript_16675:581-1285(-)
MPEHSRQERFASLHALHCQPRPGICAASQRTAPNAAQGFGVPCLHYSAPAEVPQPLCQHAPQLHATQALGLGLFPHRPAASCQSQLALEKLSAPCNCFASRLLPLYANGQHLPAVTDWWPLLHMLQLELPWHHGMHPVLPLPRHATRNACFRPRFPQLAVAVAHLSMHPPQFQYIFHSPLLHAAGNKTDDAFVRFPQHAPCVFAETSHRALSTGIPSVDVLPLPFESFHDVRCA